MYPRSETAPLVTRDHQLHGGNPSDGNYQRIHSSYSLFSTEESLNAFDLLWTPSSVPQISTLFQRASQVGSSHYITQEHWSEYSNPLIIGRENAEYAMAQINMLEVDYPSEARTSADNSPKVHDPNQGLHNPSNLEQVVRQMEKEERKRKIEKICSSIKLPDDKRNQGFYFRILKHTKEFACKNRDLVFTTLSTAGYSRYRIECSLNRIHRYGFRLPKDSSRKYSHLLVKLLIPSTGEIYILQCALNGILSEFEGHPEKAIRIVWTEERKFLLTKLLDYIRSQFI